MTETALNESELRAWIGRTAEAESVVTPANADVLTATLDRDEAPFKAGDAIPPGWHWYYFPERVKLADTAADGHARKGAFMPPVPLPRRMWASDKQTYHRPLHIGEKIRRVSTVTDVSPKTGKSGALCFVTVRHEVFGEHGLATTEELTTVYRGPTDPKAPPPAPQPPPGEAVWRRPVDPTPVMLFRYSAITMNSHRIHYDRDYTTKVEGYPGLLVHGPLIATLLLDLFRRALPEATLKTFACRAVAPLYDSQGFEVQGEPGADGRSAKVWAVTSKGALAMAGECGYEE
jgi:3-methylfumaryl-CoA hydratase